MNHLVIMCCNTLINSCQYLYASTDTLDIRDNLGNIQFFIDMHNTLFAHGVWHQKDYPHLISTVFKKSKWKSSFAVQVSWLYSTWIFCKIFCAIIYLTEKFTYYISIILVHMYSAFYSEFSCFTLGKHMPFLEQ